MWSTETSHYHNCLHEWSAKQGWVLGRGYCKEFFLVDSDGPNKQTSNIEVCALNIGVSYTCNYMVYLIIRLLVITSWSVMHFYMMYLHSLLTFNRAIWGMETCSMVHGRRSAIIPLSHLRTLMEKRWVTDFQIDIFKRLPSWAKCWQVGQVYWLILTFKYNCFILNKTGVH